jgi:hypothetical protein
MDHEEVNGCLVLVLKSFVRDRVVTPLTAAARNGVRALPSGCDVITYYFLNIASLSLPPLRI